MRFASLTRAAIVTCLVGAAAPGCRPLGTEWFALDWARGRMLGEKWAVAAKVTGCRAYADGDSLRPVFTVELDDGRTRTYGSCTESAEDFLLSGCDPDDVLRVPGAPRECRARMLEGGRVELEGSGRTWQLDAARVRASVPRLALFRALLPCLACMSLCAAPVILVVAVVAWSRGPVFPHG